MLCYTFISILEFMAFGSQILTTALWKSNLDSLLSVNSKGFLNKIHKWLSTIENILPMNKYHSIPWLITILPMNKYNSRHWLCTIYSMQPLNMTHNFWQTHEIVQ